MAPGNRTAAQYIRMSTDRQDLSPLIQKDAIAAFARANSIDVVKSYEDQGKSGVAISNRRALRELLKDVTEGPSFTEILVYDVSRWGRFQDADAAAYYEYHCRLHGVRISYVSESFSNDQTPASVLLKSMRRVMAAEYSRDIAWKSRAGQERVVAMGFQMGALPPLGYRRCSVSADGLRKEVLATGQRKHALTDRVEWVLGPREEVALVRQICRAYVRGLDLEEIANLVQSGGWRTNKGRPITTRAVKILLKNEALIGNFVWGVKSRGGKVIKCSPTRLDGSVPRIIDDSTWIKIQNRLKEGREVALARLRKPKEFKDGTKKSRRARQLSLPFQPAPAKRNYRRFLGSPHQLRNHTREFGRALCLALQGSGLQVGFDTRSNVLGFWAARVQIRLMWPIDDRTWATETRRSCKHDYHLLVVRMRELYVPLDFFLLPPGSGTVPSSLGLETPSELRVYRCASGAELTGQFKALSRSHDGGTKLLNRTPSLPAERMPTTVGL